MEASNKRPSLDEDFQIRAIGAIVREALGAILNKDKGPDLSKMTPKQRRIYRNQAALVLRNKAFHGEVRRLVDAFKETIDLSTKNDIERAYYRGAIFGLVKLNSGLELLSPGPNSQDLTDPDQDYTL